MARKSTSRWLTGGLGLGVIVQFVLLSKAFDNSTNCTITPSPRPPVSQRLVLFLAIAFYLASRVLQQSALYAQVVDIEAKR